MRRSLRRLVLAASASCVLVVVHSLVACTGDDPNLSPENGDAAQPLGDGGGGPQGDGAGGEGGVSTDLSVTPKTFDVARGAKATLKLHGAPGATVAIATEGATLADGGAPLPTSPVTAPSSVTLDAIGNASVDLVAAADAPQQGVKVTFVVSGASQSITGRVIGKPGDLDQFFGKGVGYVDFDVEPSVTIPNSILVQPDGKILVAGDTNNDMFVARFDGTGAVDPTFGTTGHVVHGTAQAPTMALLADGSIVLAALPGAPNSPRVWLLSSAGAFSDAWGGMTGYSQSQLGFDSTAVVATGGAIFVGGIENGTRQNSVVLKYFPDAGRDDTWGSNGTKSTPETNMTLAAIAAFTVDSSSKLWATGGAQTTAGSIAYALDLRFTATGGADIDAPLQAGTGLAIAAQGTKAIISASDAASTKGFLFRNAGQGVPLDPSFGDSTTHYVDLGNGIATSIAVDASNRILAVSGGAHTTFDVLRFDADGHPDPAFGANGVASIKGFAIALAVSGSFVYAVGKDDVASPQKARLARFWN